MADAPFGFKLISPFMPQYIEYYPVVTAFGTSVFKQDLVGATADQVGRVCGALGDNRVDLRVVTAGVAGEIFGVVQGTYDSDMFPTMYFLAATAGDGVIGGYLGVNIDPNAFYMVQEDSDTNAITATEGGQNVDAISTHAGNTLTGVSKMEIDSTSAAVTATLACKLIRAATGEVVTTDNTNWIVKINAAAMGANVVSQA